MNKKRSDLRFSEVVQEGHSRIDWDNNNKEYISLCSSCGTYHRASSSEFRFPHIVSADALSYVASKRAWNCCHEDQEPLDGFPEPPEEKFWIEETSL